MRRPIHAALSTVAVWLLTACASSSNPPLADKVLVAQRQSPSAPASTAVHTSAPSSPPLETGLSPPELETTLYFAPDVYQPRNEDQRLLQAHARWLAEHPQVHLLIEAHTDPSGPPDYNAELARMRALSVKKALVGYGVRSEQLETAAYGESAWSKDRGKTPPSPAAARRVELKYRLP